MKVTTASVKERREILSELGKCISGKGKSLGALFCLPGWRRVLKCLVSKGCVRGICLGEKAGSVLSQCSITGLIPSMRFVCNTEPQLLAHLLFPVNSWSIVYINSSLVHQLSFFHVSCLVLLVLMEYLDTHMYRDRKCGRLQMVLIKQLKQSF